MKHITFVPALMQGADLLRVIVRDGVEVGYLSRRYVNGPWTVYRGIGERATVLAYNVPWSLAREIARHAFDGPVDTRAQAWQGEL